MGTMLDENVVVVTGAFSPSFTPRLSHRRTRPGIQSEACHTQAQQRRNEMDIKLKDQSVIVTGGASNIGRAIVLAYAAEQTKLTIGDIDVEQAEKVAQEARALGAAAVQVVKADVTDAAQVSALFAKAVDTYGGVDVLVNNVGWDQLMFFTQTDESFWRKVIEINYIGVLNCTQAALKLMIPAQKGSIISISSDASRQNGRYGIRCNVVCPGVTVPESQDEVGGTSMWTVADAMFSADQFEKIAKTLPLRKLGRPADIANAVVFLSSPAASHVTGQVLSVSGGYSMIG